MEKRIIIQNKNLLNILASDKEELDKFIAIVQMLRELSYRIILENETYLEEIWCAIGKRYKKDENISIISKVLDRGTDYISVEEHNSIIKSISDLSKEENKSFKKILEENNLFRMDFKVIGYNLSEIVGHRNIINLEELKQVLLVFCKEINDITDFIDKVKIILEPTLFDEDIVKSIENLNDGFEKRKGEIIYHLFHIDKEVPQITSENIHIYKEIGKRMTLDCTRERDRETVDEKLTKNINGTDVNCELHSKMKRLSSKAPDRIYFCPELPSSVGEEDSGKIYIYKITGHV
ncbi:hypothetical protein [Clostridium butyricum]